tara:strand:- start:266 stop:403 length:138 start_codon:yes stop_codon:yes gene_type:complete
MNRELENWVDEIMENWNDVEIFENSWRMPNFGKAFSRIIDVMRGR